MPGSIRRRFADLPHGQVHYREAGPAHAAPVLLLHAGPGSSRQLEGLIASLAARHRIIAPDTPGNGDSAALPVADIPALAAAMQAFLATIRLPPAHVFGIHTGAAIATELALCAPDLVRTLALEGVGVFEGEVLADLMTHYTPALAPDLEGTHLLRAFQFCRDQALFFPWYRRTADARRSGGLPAAEELHALVLEVLKAHGSYAANYQAAFRWDPRPRLPRVACPLLLMAAESDPLHDATRRVAGSTHAFVGLPGGAAEGHAPARLAALEALFGGA